MKYDFTIQPMPVRIPGIEAGNDVEAQEKLQEMMDSQTDRILEAVRQSRWTVTLVRQSETYIGTDTARLASLANPGAETPSRPDPGVEATKRSEARTDGMLEQDLFA